MRKIVLPLIAIFLFSVAYGQKLIATGSNRCGSNEAIRQEMAADPVYAKKVEELLKNKGHYSERIKKGPPSPSSITIPVVVHIVYNTAEQNVSDAQIQSQIDVLNEDFTATNKDYNNYDAGYTAVKGDIDIKFCLSSIIRRQTDKTSFGVNDQVKRNSSGGSDPVDPMHVLNMWVCNLGQNVLGYAYYPGIKPEKYGAVIHYLSFGRGARYNFFANYDLGRTATHEVGHCLGLAHIWGDKNCGDDLVDDTPLHNGPNFGCPEQGLRSTCIGTPIQMTMNYMDYTYDRCMYFFTDGQAARASFFIDTDPQLISIVSSSCSSTGQSNDITATSNKGDNPPVGRFSSILLYPTVTSSQLNLSVNNVSEGKAEINIYNQAGALMMKQQVFISGKSLSQVDVSKLANGVYFFELGQGPNKETKKFIVQH
jgi:hypothetical protein